MHPATATMFEGLLMVLYFIMKDDYKHLCDYRYEPFLDGQKNELTNLDRTIFYLSYLRVAITKEYALVPAVMVRISKYCIAYCSIPYHAIP